LAETKDCQTEAKDAQAEVTVGLAEAEDRPTEANYAQAEVTAGRSEANYGKFIEGHGWLVC
jgi:hypothetical protein